MNLFRRKIAPTFNAAVQDAEDFTIVLTKPEADTAAQAERFKNKLSRWLLMQGEQNAEAPAVAAPNAAGNAQVTIRCTEAALLRIERQFAGDILRVEPLPQHQRGTIYPPKVDPFDVRFW